MHVLKIVLFYSLLIVLGGCVYYFLEEKYSSGDEENKIVEQIDRIEQTNKNSFIYQGRPTYIDLDNGVNEGIIHIGEHDVYNTEREKTNTITYDDGLYERVDQNGNEFKFSKIRISDGNVSITMMDRNLGASSPTSEGWKWDYDGCYFQWGNNYCFTGKAEYISEDYYYRMDVLHETPEHYTKSNNYTINPISWDCKYSHQGYFGDEFVVGLRDYWEDNEHHDDLWGGENDNEENNWGWDIREEMQENRKGPCPEGWHVPSAGEWGKVVEIFMKDNGNNVDGLTKIQNVSLSSDFADYLFLPNASNLNYDNMYNPGWYNAGVWTSSPYFKDKNSARVMYVYPTQYIDGSSVWSRGYGFPIRCFQNYNE